MAHFCWTLTAGIVFLAEITGLLATPARVEREVSYNGFQVWRLQSADEKSLASTIHALERGVNIDVWSRARRSAEVMVAPEHLRYVREILTSEKIDSDVVIKDVQRFLDEDFAHRQRHQKRSTKDVTRSYLSHSEITNYLRDVGQQATAANVTVSSIGLSFEGRDMPMVQLKERSLQSRQKYSIWIDAGIHAREWIAPAMALNIIHKLAFNPDNDSAVEDLMKMFDWFIVPLVNPDGYEFSRSSASSRLWRKTRTTKYSQQCPGVDANRNFGYDWNPDVGGSRDVCSDVYAGPSAFSEPESQNVRNWLRGQRGRGVMYVTMHSYGQWILYPYGSDQNKPLPDKALMQELGTVFKAKMQEVGRTYTVGNSAGLLYPAAGGSDDYAKGSENITTSYTLELSPRSYSDGGFKLPETEVNKVVEDTWKGFKSMVQRLHEKLGYPESGSVQNTAWQSGSSQAPALPQSNGLVPVHWGNTVIYLDPNDPKNAMWLQYYYRMRNGGKR